jgi:hypothetical protein
MDPEFTKQFIFLVGTQVIIGMCQGKTRTEKIAWERETIDVRVYEIKERKGFLNS